MENGGSLLTNPLFIAALVLFLVLIPIFLRQKKQTALDRVIDQYEKNEAKTSAKKKTEEGRAQNTSPLEQPAVSPPPPVAEQNQKPIIEEIPISHNEDPVPGHTPPKKKKYVSEAIDISHNEDQITSKTVDSPKGKTTHPADPQKNAGWDEDFHATPKPPGADTEPSENWIEADIPGLVIEPPSTKAPQKKGEKDQLRPGSKDGDEVLTFKSKPRGRTDSRPEPEKTASPSSAPSAAKPKASGETQKKSVSEASAKADAREGKQGAKGKTAQPDAQKAAAGEKQGLKDKSGSKTSPKQDSKQPAKKRDNTWDFSTTGKSRAEVKKRAPDTEEKKDAPTGKTTPGRTDSPEKNRKIFKKKPKLVENKDVVVSHKDIAETQDDPKKELSAPKAEGTEKTKPAGNEASKSLVTETYSVEEKTEEKPGPFFLDLKYLVQEELEAAGPEAQEKLSPEMIDRIVARLNDLQINLEQQLISLIPRVEVEKSPDKPDTVKEVLLDEPPAVQSPPPEEELLETGSDTKVVSLDELDSFLFTGRQRKTRL